MNPGQKTTGQKTTGPKITKNANPGQKATKLAFLRRNLKSPDCVFFYSRAGEKKDKK